MNKLALALALGGLSIAVAQAETWQRIDFDADLTTYLVSSARMKREGNLATVWELNVPGRTAISTGAQNHTLVERLFDCQTKTQTIGQVLMYAQLGAPAQSLTHADISYEVQSGSLDEIEMNMACDSTQPAQDVYTKQTYASLEAAVNQAFGDAVKLPREQSNKTLKGLGDMGGPPPNGNNTGANGPGTNGSGTNGPSQNGMAPN